MCELVAVLPRVGLGGGINVPVLPELTEMGRAFDISPRIHSGLAVFPGDQKFERSVSLDCAQGAAFTLSSIHTTVHLGAHTDAPNHYHASGQGIDSRPLDFYLGKAQVISVEMEPGERIRPEHVKDAIRAPRVLFKTGSFPNPDVWTSDFNSLSNDLVDFLAAHQVRLVGLDTPSIDPAEDKKLESHHAVYRHDMAVLEGIALTNVSPGLYQLIALPLLIAGADASPVRAILIEQEYE